MDYDKSEVLAILTLIENDSYNTTRPSNLILTELIRVIQYLDERVSVLEDKVE